MKQLTYVHGDLLRSKGVEIIGHQCNCQNTFGSGIARSIKEMYPKAYYLDCMAAKEKVNKLGNISVATVIPEDHELSDIRFIFNLYGQNLGTDKNKLYDRKTDYEALFTALQKMATYFKDDHPLDTLTVGLPYKIGCGLGSGDWNIVERLIEVAFKNYYGDVRIYDIGCTVKETPFID
jgi:O-acetyl-ADP-ribose deacetylase (regulator of RNase III)